MAKKTRPQVIIDGKDVSSSFWKYLMDLRVSLKSGGSSDKATIRLDDRRGVLLLPKDDAAVLIRIDGVEVFRGKVTDVESSGARGEGRVLTIEADGVDSKGKAKEPKQKHWDKKKLKDILSEAGKEAGIPNVQVDSQLGDIEFEYEAMDNESFMAFGQRLAEAVGGTFAVSDDRAAMVKRSSGKSASGKALTPIVAAWGVNLISWKIKPFSGRSRFKKVKQQYYDRKAAKWVTAEVEVQDDGAKAEHTARYAGADKGAAERKAENDKTAAEREKGGGSIGIDGDARAFPEAPLTLTGARPGADGSYVIDSVDHSVSRSAFTTDLEVKKPGGDAGKDSRKPAPGGAPSPSGGSPSPPQISSS